MGFVTLNDIIITTLPRIETVGGDVLHAMKNTDIGFAGYGEAYFSTISFGAIKAWKRHNEMVMNLIVPFGKVRFVFHVDESISGPDFRTIEISKEKYARITVPRGIWFGFQGLSQADSLILNIASIPHDQGEVERKDVNEIKFDWEKEEIDQIS